MPIIFQCPCGARLKARDDQAGTSVTCPRCRKGIVVPGVPPSAADQPPAWPIVPIVLIAAAVPIVLIMLAPIVLGMSLKVVAAWLLLLIAIPIVPVVYVLVARTRAFRHHAREADLFLGFVKMILWDPTEGVVLLRNKQIDFVDSNTADGGGVKFIYPGLGQELGLRVPLTIQPVEFRNNEVYTRDSIPLFMRIAIWWRLADLRAYYLSISREVHLADEQGSRRMRDSDDEYKTLAPDARQQLDAAERWITMTAEEETRSFVSGISTSLLVADQIRASLPATPNSPASDEIELDRSEAPAAAGGGEDQSKYLTATNLLVERLQPRLNAKLAERGLHVERVALQEVRLPQEIHQKAVDAAKAWYGMLEAQRLGRGEAAKVQELANVLGKDAVAMAEVLKSAHGMTFFQLPQFLDQVFTRALGGPPAAAGKGLAIGQGEATRLPP